MLRIVRPRAAETLRSIRIVSNGPSEKTSPIIPHTRDTRPPAVAPAKRTNWRALRACETWKLVASQS